jgi:hypothetical protein
MECQSNTTSGSGQRSRNPPSTTAYVKPKEQLQNRHIEREVASHSQSTTRPRVADPTARLALTCPNTLLGSPLLVGAPRFLLLSIGARVPITHSGSLLPTQARTRARPYRSGSGPKVGAAPDIAD